MLLSSSYALTARPKAAGCPVWRAALRVSAAKPTAAPAWMVCAATSRCPPLPARPTHVHASKRSRRRTLHARAAANEPPSAHEGWEPFSAELCLSMARLGHLERFRDELRALHKPGLPRPSQALDLTRCGLLISNLFLPQLDHRPYFQRLEDLVASATLAVVSLSCFPQTHPGSWDEGGGGLDPAVPADLLAAIAAVNEVLFVGEGLAVNEADPHDPLNGSLADVLDARSTGRRYGNQFSLAIIWLHVAAGLGLTCQLVGSRERVLLRVGEPAGTACFVVDPARGGAVYAYSAARAGAAALAQLAQPQPAAGGEPRSPCDAGEQADAAWNASLHAWLREHAPAAAAEPGEGCAGAGAGNCDDDETSASRDASSQAGGGEDGGWNLDEAAVFAEHEPLDSLGDGSGSSSSSSLQSWREVESYASADAATRNSWKALYGPGALSEWGGLVGCSSSGSSGAGAAAAWRGDDTAWFGVLDSPFAAPAVQQQPLPGQAGPSDRSASPSASPLASASMETACGSSRQASWAGSDADASHESSGDEATSLPGPGGLSVQFMPDEELLAAGCLQPLSQRVLLQQLLVGMKLSLALSGRHEEALMVLRHLRAVEPFSLVDLRDEALTLAAQGRPEEAAPLLREYLGLAPRAEDAGMVAELLQQQLLAAELARNRARRERH